MSMENGLKEDIVKLQLHTKGLADIVEEIQSNDEKYTKETLNLLTNNIKVLIHNQAILENKIDDNIKNQFNTDQVVNELNWKVTRLLQIIASDVKDPASIKKHTNKIQSLNNSKVNYDEDDITRSLENTVVKLPMKQNIPKTKKYYNPPSSNDKLLVQDNNVTASSDGIVRIKPSSDNSQLNYFPPKKLKTGLENIDSTKSDKES
ncbi:hypothetical protein FOG51_01709 [Hanseniaspora uvarum]|jgi:hypothetical protein|uniref:Uncharacterized protein n=1 Tax=Hanseniaspora uvarum TaxID=29833 RepID=A0A1E5RYR0_HANUV|nr:hypothetical protein FOG48_00299 [Hanseniaspora uvarum]KAF0273207.1 hypothetical protein FOG51_01709 [Hanseniaspora uvarum]KAF0278933.1 hypothetical protein FOG50_00212 [Hanseniaspora uvarum]KKA03429.1 Suppressor of mar1-1 protein [Hanseniaspora uvarum DSM 2768]OEJ91878.1 hypothetical protein AWRI3580_g942 [Hanseniaspora uvarum]